jgi:hypothetical protein
LALSLALTFATGAFASGTPVNVGTPFEVDGLAVATDNAGDAVLAWANDKDLPPITTDIVQYCVLPVDATGCTESGNLIPADNASHVDHVQVLDEGSTIVVLADVYGASGAHSEEYEPEQEWQSTDGGATFSIIDGGKSVTTGVLSADTQPLSAVTLPGTGVLGYGWDTAGSSPPTFNAFPLTSPPQCSVKECTAGFASLEPNTNPDQIGNEGGQFAAQGGATPGVIGIFETDFSNGPLGCSGPGTASFGTAYVYGTGNQSSTNNYNISPGTANSAWKVATSQADCDVEYAAVDGGPSGFGVLEDNLATNQAVYHRLDQSTDKFDTPLATIAPEFEEQPSVSQDGAGGIYATYLSGFGGAIRLAYSGDGGNSWASNTLNADSEGGAGNLTSDVNAAGQGWATWTDNGSVYAQSFQAADAIAPAIVSPPTPTSLTTEQTAGTTSGANITIPGGTVGETDQATISGANAASASGTVAYHLYSNPTCTATSEVAKSTAAVASGKAAASAGITASLAPGKYYWQATYSGNASNLASASTCGSEVLTIVPAATIGGSGTSTEKSVTVDVSCATFPCTITLTLTAPETVVVHAARAAKKKSKPKKITLATGTFTLHRAGKVTLHLSKAGKKLLAAHHGSLTASLLLSEKIDGHTILISKTIKIKPAAKKHKK